MPLEVGVDIAVIVMAIFLPERNGLLFSNDVVFVDNFNTHNSIWLVQKQLYECPYGEYWEKENKHERSDYRLTLKRLPDAFERKYEKQDQQHDADDGKLLFHRLKIVRILKCEFNYKGFTDFGVTSKRKQLIHKG